MSEINLSTGFAQVTTLFQADCPQCGWHTRQADQKQWVREMADAHEKVCPNPPPPPLRRNGMTASCGCWYFGMPGNSVGRTVETCPRHGTVGMVEANVYEIDGEATGKWWTHPIETLKSSDD